MCARLLLLCCWRRLGVVLGKGLVRRHGEVPEPDHSPSPHPGGPGSLRSQQSSGSDCPSSRAAWQLQSAPAAFSTLANSHTCEADRPSFPKDREATCPSPLLPGSQTHDGCSSPLFTLLTGCSQDGRLAPAQAAASCRRSRHRHLRRRGRSVGGRACQLVSLSACVLVRL